MKITLVIPAYNEEERLPAFLDTVLAYTQTHSTQIQEVIVVDDGSTDATVDTIGKRLRIQPQPLLRLIKLPRNQGKGAAVQAGVMAASGDAVVFIDADGATPITELPKMVKALQDADVAIGNRWLSGAHVKKSTPLRHIAGWIYKTYMAMFGLRGIDTMCGFKGYKREVARKLFSNLQEKRWLFDTEIAYKAVRSGYHIKNFPIDWESKEGSKLDPITLVKSGLLVLPLILKIRKDATQT